MGSRTSAYAALRSGYEHVEMLADYALGKFYGACDVVLSPSLASDARLEKAFRDWFAATETYAPQLHEIGENEYLAMKRKEIQHQQATAKGTAKPPPASPDKY